MHPSRWGFFVTIYTTERNQSMTQKEDINQLKKKNNTPAHHFATPKPYLGVKNFKNPLVPIELHRHTTLPCSTVCKRISPSTKSNLAEGLMRCYAKDTEA